MTNDIDITHLSPSECILLADQLWERARAHAEAIPVTPEQIEELNRRLDALDAGRMEPGEPWEIVRKRLWGLMSPAIILTPAAEMDIAEARNWYDSISPALAPDFRSALDETLGRIANHPNAYALVARGLRRAFLRRFPHGVFYRNHENAIQVVAVLHPSRSPHVWQARNH